MREAPHAEPVSPAPDPAPLGDSEIDRLFAALDGVRAMALAVSGGADSLALLLAVHRWAARRSSPPTIQVLTVDHGLRPTAPAEAAFVTATAGRLGIAAETLIWRGPRPASGIEAAARDARYALLAEAAARIGATHLLTAHHRDDQAETFLLRLTGGSGLTGLAAMRPRRDLAPGLTLFRPFLGIPKSRLVATVAAAGLRPVEDDSNRDRRFARARLRALMPALADEGLGSETLARAATRLARASDAIGHHAGRLVAAAVTVDPLAVARLDRARYAAEPAEVRLRALTRLLAAIGGATFPPASERLEALDLALAGSGRFRRTLGGVVIGASGATAMFVREQGRSAIAGVPVTGGFAAVWDHRFRIGVVAAPPAPVLLGPLGEAGRRELVASGAVTKPPAPPAALAMLPAFRSAGRLIAVPSLGFSTPIATDFRVRVDCIVTERLG